MSLFKSSVYLQERFPGMECWRAKDRVIGDTCQKVKKHSIWSGVATVKILTLVLKALL